MEVGAGGGGGGQGDTAPTPLQIYSLVGTGAHTMQIYILSVIGKLVFSLVNMKLYFFMKCS